MTLFRKLFTSYLVIMFLALLISSGFAGYMAWDLGGRTQLLQLTAYAEEMAETLGRENGSPRAADQVAMLAGTLDRSETAYTWVTDRDGRVVQATPRAAIPASGRISVPDLERVPHGDSIWLHPRAGINRNLTVIAPISVEGQTVGAVVMVPSLVWYSEGRMLILRFILYGVAIACVVVAGLSYYISQMVARPMEQISRAARRVARGDFAARVDWHSSDEVGRLADDFNEMATDLDRLESARKELMANVSHELKGPLARVAGYLEAISDGIGGEEARREHFAVVKREVGRLTRLVNDLLDFSRLEAGRLKLYLIPCNLRPNLVRAAEVFRAPAAAAGIQLEIDLPDELPVVECEPERMEQVLTNLLENALAHTPQGGTVTVWAREASEWLHLEVRDTGSGIAAEELERIWDRFYKRDLARTPRGSGFGLGLTIVKQLTELQGGVVHASSQPGQGTVVGLRLPLARPS